MYTATALVKEPFIDSLSLRKACLENLHSRSAICFLTHSNHRLQDYHKICPGYWVSHHHGGMLSRNTFICAIKRTKIALGNSAECFSFMFPSFLKFWIELRLKYILSQLSTSSLVLIYFIGMSARLKCWIFLCGVKFPHGFCLSFFFLQNPNFTMTSPGSLALFLNCSRADKKININNEQFLDLSPQRTPVICIFFSYLSWSELTNSFK